LKLVQASDRHLAAGSNGRRSPGVDDGADCHGAAGLEPGAGGGARFGYEGFAFWFKGIRPEFVHGTTFVGCYTVAIALRMRQG
jgi:hypothetical protein